VQNTHRYFFYIAGIISIINSYDAIVAFHSDSGPGGFGFGLGNVLLLALYTFSCHSWRHLIGGKINCYSCSLASRTRYGVWKRVSFLNERHAWFAWASLFSVMIVDFYIRLVATGAIQDVRFF
jgi:hypothetical protein